MIRRRFHMSASAVRSSRRRTTASAAPRAFTLTEMLVALAVMVLAMAMVTSVFSITTKTAATSAAIGEVETLLRNVTEQLRQDLENCDPSQSILVIHGRTQAAALTEDLRAGGLYYREMVGDPDPNKIPIGYDTSLDSSIPSGTGTTARDQFSDPRADILMLITNRPTASRAPATALPDGLSAFQNSLQRGARVAPVQVVYGHAAFDRAAYSGTAWAFADDLTHIESANPLSTLSPLPANRWYLSRRAVPLDPNTARAPDPRYGFTYSYQGEREMERIIRGHSGSIYSAGDSAHLKLSDFLRMFSPAVNKWDGIWHGTPLHRPYDVPSDSGWLPFGFTPPPGTWTQAEEDWINNILYRGGLEANHHVATIIEQPPAELRDNLALHLLPGCVWFEVEILVPEDPRNGLDHPLSDQRRDTPRWVQVDHDHTFIFVPDSDENRTYVESEAIAAGPMTVSTLGLRASTFAQVIPPGSIGGITYGGPDTIGNRRVRMWPYAIRITVRAYDRSARLDRPVVRSLVHRFD